LLPEFLDLKVCPQKCTDLQSLVKRQIF